MAGRFDTGVLKFKAQRSIVFKSQWSYHVTAAGKKHACFFPKYHPGVWTKSLGRYSCCDQIDRNAVGCSLTTPEKDDATVPSVSKQQSVINKPLPPKPEDNNQSRDKKFFIAIYNFTPVEDGDLELQQGEEYEVVDDTRDHWWIAQNKAGLQGYIPANYIKKKFDLEIFDWFCKSYSRERSEQVLRKEGREGCFLVRESSTPRTGMFTLSLYTSESDGTVKHYHIKKNTEGMFYIAEKHAFPSVQDLVHYHKHDSAGLSTRLRSPPAPEGGKTAPATAGFGHSKYEIDPTEIVKEQQLGAGCFGPLPADDDIPPPRVPRKPLQGRPTPSVPSGPPAVPTSSRPSQSKPQPQKPLPADDDIPPPRVPRKPLQGRPTPSVPSGPPAVPTSSRPSQSKPQPQKFLHTYDKLAGQRGLLLVINFKFAGQNERTASEEDVRKLHSFFSELDYDIVCQFDMTTNELKRSLEKIRYEYLTRQSHKYHCFICVIMSHGSELGIATQDGTIKVDDLVRPFKNDNAFSFIGKPKIFIIQSCRGGRSQVKEQYIEPNIINEADSTVCARLPTDADIIKIFATTPGYYSYRKVDSTSWRGAWFIQAFIAVARELPKSHIQEILTAVTHELAINPEYEIDGEKCQLPMFEAALSKLFYLK